MTKKEMKRKLDIVMLGCMNAAIYCSEKGYDSQRKEAIHEAVGVLQSASILKLIDDNEFSNICHILCNTTLRW